MDYWCSSSDAIVVKHFGHNAAHLGALLSLSSLLFSLDNFQIFSFSHLHISIVQDEHNTCKLILDRRIYRQATGKRHNMRLNNDIPKLIYEWLVHHYDLKMKLPYLPLVVVIWGNIGLSGWRLAGGAEAILIWLAIAHYLHPALQQQRMTDAEF
jgi:hypothetical protein